MGQVFKRKRHFLGKYYRLKARQVTGMVDCVRVRTTIEIMKY